MATTANKPKDEAKTKVVADSDAPLYRAKVRHYINGRRIEAGQTVTYHGTPGSGLEPANAAAEKAVAARDKKPAKEDGDKGKGSKEF